MVLEAEKELIEAIKNKEVNFFEMYNKKDIKMWEDEISKLFELKATKRLKELLGYTLYYVAMNFNQDKKDYEDYNEDDFIVKLGFNPADYEYITQFAIAVIIDDFENIKLFGNPMITEALQKEYVKFEND